MAETTLLHPRPEYPRPDFQRGIREGYDWLNLNGPWDFRFDGDRIGEHERWFAERDTRWRQQIIVPFCWESLAAWGEGDRAGNESYYATRSYLNPLEVTPQNYRHAARYEVGWYKREFCIPANAAWQGKRVMLRVGAADFCTDAWCNGHHVGHHEGGYTPFAFDVTDALERQANGLLGGTLVLRVEDPMDNHEQPVGKQWRWYTPTSGIWQTVYLEPRAEAHVRHFRFDSNIDNGTVRICVVTEQAEDHWLTVSIQLPGTDKRQNAALRVREGRAEGVIQLEVVKLWDPNDPVLYQTTLRLEHGREVFDIVQTYFGLRKLDTAPAEDPKAPAVLRFNNHPRYLRGALYQSYHPEGVYTAPTAARIRHDILAAKEFGFNFLRIHIKIDDPLVYYYADKLGVFIMADFPNFGEGGDTPLGRKRFEQMMRQGIERDYNHPSIIAWCLFNETWGFGGQVDFVEIISPRGKGQPAPPPVERRDGKLTNLGAHPWVNQIWELAQQLDETRLIEDMSVCHWGHLEYFLHGHTDINSWHFYNHDYATAKDHIAQVVANTYQGSEFNYLPGFGHRGEPLINSEYGGIGALDGDRDISWSFKFLTNELRRHGEISAYIFTELTDVEWEYNGFLNYDRTYKEFGYDPRPLNESNQLPIDAPPVQRVQPGQAVKIPVASSHYSTKQLLGVRLRWKLSGQDTWGRLHPDLASGEVPIPFPHRRVAHAATLQIPMPDFPVLATLDVEAIEPDFGHVVARNFVELYVCGELPPRREQRRNDVALRIPAQDWSEATWSLGHTSREEAAEADAAAGRGVGYFRWEFPLDEDEGKDLRRIRVLIEASAHRPLPSQTDCHSFPTDLVIELNGVIIHQSLLPNHPHDARGALSYLRGGKGAYGYLISTVIEGPMLEKVRRHGRPSHLQLTCRVPDDGLHPGGLVVYGPESGRSPVGPSIILEW